MRLPAWEDRRYKGHLMKSQSLKVKAGFCGPRAFMELLKGPFLLMP